MAPISTSSAQPPRWIRRQGKPCFQKELRNVKLVINRKSGYPTRYQQLRVRFDIHCEYGYSIDIQLDISVISVSQILYLLWNDFLNGCYALKSSLISSRSPQMDICGWYPDMTVKDFLMSRFCTDKSRYVWISIHILNFQVSRCQSTTPLAVIGITFYFTELPMEHSWLGEAQRFQPMSRDRNEHAFGVTDS